MRVLNMFSKQSFIKATLFAVVLALLLFGLSVIYENQRSLALVNFGALCMIPAGSILFGFDIKEAERTIVFLDKFLTPSICLVWFSFVAPLLNLQKIDELLNIGAIGIISLSLAYSFQEANRS